MSAQPLLSVVAASRNDDHGHNLLGRMQAFVNGFIGQCKRHALPAELILVEWNPPQDRPRLAEALEWPAEFGPCQVRIIEVPPELHARFQHADRLPLYQMIAKNVGIRRARGQYVLATNIDILFSDELMRLIASGGLQPGRMYRMDRHDVMSEVPANEAVDEQLAFCRTHLLRVNAREGTFRLNADGELALEKDDILAEDCGIGLGTGWYALERDWCGPHRWVHQDAALIVRETDARPVMELELEAGPGVENKPFILQVLNEARQVIAQGEVGLRRRRVCFSLPPANGGSFSGRQTYFLRSLAGDQQNPDGSIYNFRVYKCAWSDPVGWDPSASTPETFNFQTEEVRFLAENDVVPGGAGIQIGHGWHELETDEGESFRWVASGANMHLDVPERRSPSPHLLMELEPGPGVRHRPFDLIVSDDQEREVARIRVEGREIARIPVPASFRACRLTLRTPNGGWRILRDPRLLEFRVFRLSWSPMPEPAGLPAAPAEEVAQEALQGAQARVRRKAETSGQAGDRADRGTAVGTAVAESVVAVMDGPGAPGSLASSASRRMENRDGLPGESRSENRDEATPARIDMKTRWRSWQEGARRRPIRNALGALVRRGKSWVRLLRAAVVHGLVRLRELLPRLRPPVRPLFLHTNGCGDFTLMARNHWRDLRGYPEFDTFSLHIDSVFCHIAHHAGVAEQVLREPLRIYHIEHSTGSGWTPEGVDRLMERMAAKKVPVLAHEKVTAWARWMNKRRRPILFNRASWGLGGEVLHEIELGA